MSEVEPWLDSRRLMGPSLFMHQPGAFLEVAETSAMFDQQIAAWRKLMERLLSGVGWGDSQQVVRRHQGGAILVISAPPDALLTATELNETAWALAVGEGEDGITSKLLADFRNRIQQESNPQALRIYEAAQYRGVSALLDENGVSIGMGQGSQHWTFDTIPDLENVSWDGVYDIPVAIVTGTNGKTTSVRLIAAMVAASGKTSGFCSTDSVTVDDEKLDDGDYSGPAGARLVLRDHRTQVAILETARGGLLRRGLGCQKANVAMVTNIAADHLGDGGIRTLEDLANVKFMVARCLVEDGIMVANADDALCVRYANQVERPKFWFSLSPPPKDRSGDWCWYERDALFVRQDGRQLRIAPVSDVPITLNGSAQHNIANALAASAVALSLGVPLQAIRDALNHFGSRPEDNPGRANLYRFGEVSALIDFAHNPDGVKAILKTAKSLSENRLAIVFGQAGDRTDQAIVDLTRNVVEAEPDLIIVKEMDDYRRGRPAGEIPELIRTTLDDLGYNEDQVLFVASELDSVELIWEWAQPGDLLTIFAHTDRQEVVERLEQLSFG